MQTTSRVVLRHMLCVDGAVDLLDHLEVLVDSVAGIGVERHILAGQLKGSRRQVVDVGNADVRTLSEGQTGTPSSKQELILGRQARITARDA